MNTNIDIRLMEEMTEGVIFLNRAGHILDFNRAARPWLKPCFSATEKIANLINDSLCSKSTAPVPISFLEQAAGHTQSVNVHLCTNGLSGFVLFITAQRAYTAGLAQATASEKPESFSLVGAEIRHELTHMRDRIATLTASVGLSDLTAVNQSSERLSRLFVVMDQLSRLNQGESLDMEQRLSPQDLINEVLADMTTQSCDFAINQELSNSPQQLGMLYGDSEWLKCGLKGLLESIGDSGPPRGKVELRVRQSGGFLVLTGGFTNTARPRIVSPPCNANVAPIIGTQPDIRISIARRIFELHRGQLKVFEMDSNNPDEHSRGIEAFSLSLPTGVPHQAQRPIACNDCPSARQAEAYARDLAFLLPTTHTNSQVTQDELDFLKNVMSDLRPPTKNKKTLS